MQNLRTERSWRKYYYASRLPAQTWQDYLGAFYADCGHGVKNVIRITFATENMLHYENASSVPLSVNIPDFRIIEIQHH